VLTTQRFTHLTFYNSPSVSNFNNLKLKQSPWSGIATERRHGEYARSHANIGRHMTSCASVAYEKTSQGKNNKQNQSEEKHLWAGPGPSPLYSPLPLLLFFSGSLYSSTCLWIAPNYCSVARSSSSWTNRKWYFARREYAGMTPPHFNTTRIKPVFLPYCFIVSLVGRFCLF
jgi:hypothetical protein